MKPRMTRSLATAGLLLAACAQSALAHTGHGLQAASHWHASDTLGVLLVAGMAAAALWLSRR